MQERLVTNLICVLLVVVVFSLRGDSAALVSEQGEKVYAGSDVMKFGDRCLDVIAFMSSGDFFRGIKIESKAGKRRFRKQSVYLVEYPNRVTFLFDIQIIECRRPQDPTSDSLSDEFVESLRFQAFRKTGFNMKALEAVVSRDARTLADRVQKRWRVDVHLETSGVPLTDHLVLDVHSGSGARISRFSGRL